MTESTGSTYFRRASLFWMMVISLSMGFFMWTICWPSHMPFQSLGPAGSFIKYLVNNHYKWLYWGFWVAWGFHIIEAFYAMKLCSAKGITNHRVQLQWVLQTLLFGAASLSLLFNYKPGQLKKS
ncbi:transmembrane protein 254 isoform X2 [Microcaecilia unicolor]|uniref:Transmembrane protein 254 n=1 Tax=Microcaecilia unicolor TaxID=1415580 RepID=A0A6P7YD28_9AMPH|nr:transmembrane protein 254 isoform X2 [Microcaecilia unicolor]